jgi:hypothetical protein
MVIVGSSVGGSRTELNSDHIDSEERVKENVADLARIDA